MSAPALPNQKIVHVYDDIEEEDNQLPHWWLAILFGAIVFAFGYWFVYEVTATLPSPLARFVAASAASARKLASGLGSVAVTSYTNQ